ncbi:hypothetical protein D3Z60_23650 [Lachnospiraceae bacterium]|nr:hypothetical protein [Lachnospiraceae bacterium]
MKPPWILWMASWECSRVHYASCFFQYKQRRNKDFSDYVEIEDVTVRYENGLHSADNLFCREKSLKEYRIKDVDIHEFLHFIMEDGRKLPADFDMLQKSGNYLIHVDGDRAFCLNEREIYLKDSMENLMARSLPYFSDTRISFSVRIKDRPGKADITILDNRRLSKEITRKQAKGKSLTIRYRSGKTRNTRLSTEQYIRGPFGEKVNCICYAYLADALIRMRQDMFSGRGDFLPFVYQAENERSLSATVREIHTMREKTFEAATMEQFRREWEEMQSLRIMDQYNYQRGRPDSERIKSFQQEIKQAGYQQVTEQMAAQAASFNLPVFSLTKRGTIAHVRDINALDKKAPVFMKKDWLVMLDILANKKEIPCSRNTLVCLKNAARDAYDKAEETDKPKLAGIAAKISCFLEAVDKKGLSGILRDDSILFSEKTELPPFLSNTEKERFRHIYEAGAKEQMAVAERAAYYPGRER